MMSPPAFTVECEPRYEATVGEVDGVALRAGDRERADGRALGLRVGLRRLEGADGERAADVHVGRVGGGALDVGVRVRLRRRVALVVLAGDEAAAEGAARSRATSRRRRRWIVTLVPPTADAVPTSLLSHASVVPLASALDLLWPTPTMPPEMPVEVAIALLVAVAVIWIAPAALRSPADVGLRRRRVLRRSSRRR